VTSTLCTLFYNHIYVHAAHCPLSTFFTATMRSTLNRLLAGRGRGVEEKKCVNPVLGVQVHADKNSLMGYNIDQEPRVFLQVFVAMPTMVPTLKRVLEEDGVEFPAGSLITQLPKLFFMCGFIYGRVSAY